MEMKDFMTKLGSAAATPSGGGAAALNGATATAMASMVAQLTVGKKKYAAYEANLKAIIHEMAQLNRAFLTQINADAKGFAPLAKAYSIPKTDPNREAILNAALLKATAVPFEILKLANALLPVLEQLLVQGSRLLQSDVGVAATTLRSTLEAAVLNIYVNTQLLTDQNQAAVLNQQAEALVAPAVVRCQAVYQQVLTQLQAQQ